MKPLAQFSDAELANALDALSSPVRLAIARALREPRCLSEIGVGPASKSGSTGVRGAILARQSVKEHIDRMTSAGIVVARKVPSKGRTTTEYVLNPDSLAVISQAVHDLTRCFAITEPTSRAALPPMATS